MLASGRCGSLTSALFSPCFLSMLSLSLPPPHRLLHEGGPDTVDELLDRNLLAKNQKKSEEEGVERRRVTSIRRESLCLYRDILRATRFFSWPDARGEVWRDVLRSNARREFEEAKFERDPEIITRLLIGGRDAVHSALNKLAEAQRKKIADQQEQQKKI